MTLTHVLGIVRADGGVHPWTWTDPSLGNPWRARAKGQRVVTFMMWLYCDDTSGNVSKKWNKHNSWLFTAAGLPRELGQQESNVHFLATSNLAPPLEMLDGIVSQLEYVSIVCFYLILIVSFAGWANAMASGPGMSRPKNVFL